MRVIILILKMINKKRLKEAVRTSLAEMKDNQKVVKLEIVATRATIAKTNRF